MSLKKLVANYAEYNSWVNKKFIDWLSTKPEELLHQETPSSFNSIIKTLNHIWATEEYWYSVIAEVTDFENRNQVEVLINDEVFNGLVKRSQLLAELIQSFSEDELQKKIKIENPWFQCNLPRYEYLMQVVNHGTYHRGQIVTMGRALGITDASNSDYNFFNVMKEQH